MDHFSPREQEHIVVCVLSVCLPCDLTRVRSSSAVNENTPNGAMQFFTVYHEGTISLVDTFSSGGNGPPYCGGLSTGQVAVVNVRDVSSETFRGRSIDHCTVWLRYCTSRSYQGGPLAFLQGPKCLDVPRPHHRYPGCLRTPHDLSIWQ